MKILILNGPNLNLLGKREPHIYGNETLEDIIGWLQNSFTTLTIEHKQSNHEGVLIDALHQSTADAVIINAGALSHYSYALYDALLCIEKPKIEVHMSNLFARVEGFRHTSVLSPACNGVICGFGKQGYWLAIQYLVENLPK